MRPILKFIAVAVVLGSFVGIALLVNIFLEINDHIDRCADQTSGRYIFDNDTRAAACKNG